MQEIQGLELWQLPVSRIKEAVITAFEVYKQVIASKYKFDFQQSIVDSAVELYENWGPYSILLAYQTKSKEIIATSCLTQKKPGICFLIEDEFIKYATENALPLKEYHFYYGSLTCVNKNLLQTLNINNSISYHLYNQMNFVLGQIVAKDEKNLYLAEFEKTAFLLINKSLSMGWKQIGKETAWLGSVNLPAYLPSEKLASWIKKNNQK